MKETGNDKLREIYSRGGVSALLSRLCRDAGPGYMFDRDFQWIQSKIFFLTGFKFSFSEIETLYHDFWNNYRPSRVRHKNGGGGRAASLFID